MVGDSFEQQPCAVQLDAHTCGRRCLAPGCDLLQQAQLQLYKESRRPQHHAEESLQMLGSDCRQEKHSAFVAKVSKTAE